MCVCVSFSNILNGDIETYMYCKKESCRASAEGVEEVFANFAHVVRLFVDFQNDYLSSSWLAVAST